MRSYIDIFVTKNISPRVGYGTVIILLPTFLTLFCL